MATIPIPERCSLSPQRNRELEPELQTRPAAELVLCQGFSWQLASNDIYLWSMEYMTHIFLYLAVFLSTPQQIISY